MPTELEDIVQNELITPAELTDIVRLISRCSDAELGTGVDVASW